MKRSTLILALAVAVAAVATIPIAGLAATGDQVAADDGNATATNETADENATIAPGQRLSGVVGVQQAELEGEIDSRAFGLQVANATNNSRAAVVAERLGDVERRLDQLEQRKQELDRARKNGSMNYGQYAAEAAEIAARTQTVDRLANQSGEVVRGLPAERLQAHGINVTAIQMLQDRASELVGPQVAEIARNIGGPGMAPGHGGPGDHGAPGDRAGGNATDGQQDGQATPGGDMPGQNTTGQNMTGHDDNRGDDTATATPTDTASGDDERTRQGGRN